MTRQREKKREEGRREGGAAYLVLLLVYIHKPGRLDALALQAVLDDRHGPAHPEPALDKELAKLAHGGALVDGPVVAAELGRRLVALDPAAGLERAEGLAEERVPVLDAPKQPADVDVVERVLGKRPLLRAVVDLAFLTVSTSR